MTSIADLNTTTSLGTQKALLDVSLFPRAVHHTIVGLYVFVTSLGICGNILVLYLFVSKKIRHKSFNVLLLNLSIADLLADIFSYPYIFAGINLSHLRKLSIENANLACAFTLGLTPFWTVTMVSVFILSFISLTRCVKIIYPMKCNWITSRRSVIIFIIMAWMSGILLPFPNFLSFKYIQKTAVCDRDNYSKAHQVIYRVFYTLMSFFIPVAVMLITFLLIACTLWKRSSMFSETSSLPIPGMVRKRKAVKLLGTLIAVFLICWSPFFIYFVLVAIMPRSFWENNLDSKVICATILAALCNTVADPIVYALRGDEFRKGLKDTLQQLQSVLILCSGRKDPANVETCRAVEVRGIS